MTETIIYPIILIVGGFIGFLLRNYLSSYVSEKGKNLATKEDITLITQQIETVKASIQTLTQIKTDYEQQRRQWLLSFYDSAVEMLYEKFGISFGEFPLDDGKSLFEFQRSFNATISAMVKQYQRIVLYFPHEHQLRVHAEEVLNSALKAHKIFRRRFGPVKISFIEEQTAHQSGERSHFQEAVDKSNATSKAYWDEMQPIVKEFRDALVQYLTSLNQFMIPSADSGSG